jgi:hypothetical protein
LSCSLTVAFLHLSFLIFPNDLKNFISAAVILLSFWSQYSWQSACHFTILHVSRTSLIGRSYTTTRISYGEAERTWKWPWPISLSYFRLLTWRTGGGRWGNNERTNEWTINHTQHAVWIRVLNTIWINSALKILSIQKFLTPYY